MKHMHATGQHGRFSLACEEGEVPDQILALGSGVVPPCPPLLVSLCLGNHVVISMRGNNLAGG